MKSLREQIKKIWRNAIGMAPAFSVFWNFHLIKPFQDFLCFMWKTLMRALHIELVKINASYWNGIISTKKQKDQYTGDRQKSNESSKIRVIIQKKIILMISNNWNIFMEIINHNDFFSFFFFSFHFYEVVFHMKKAFFSLNDLWSSCLGEYNL